MHSFSYRDKVLHCEDVNLEKLADQIGTPVYVYSGQTIRTNFRRLRAALQPLDHMICYAVKACSNLAILSLLIREGAAFDIVSGGELFRVLESGRPR